MKIAIITNYWIKSKGGGVREYNKNLVKTLEKKGVDVKVLFSEGFDDENFKMPSNRVLFIFKAYFILKKITPDAILAHGRWFTEIPAILYKIVHPKTKIFVLFHTQYDAPLPIHHRLLYNLITNKFDKVGFVSKALKKNIRDVAGLKIKKDTFILYAGAEKKEVHSREVKEFKDKYHIPENSIVLLALGLTELEYKAEGAKLLIQAVKIIRDRGYNIVLILTRRGKYVEKLKKFTKKMGIEKHVIFTGDIENPFVPLALCDIYTHITLGEGLPIALLEAMAMGKPIIATPVGGIPEAIENGKNGILVRPDPEKIAEAIKLLIENKDLREKLGSAAKKTAKERFRWEYTAKKFLRIVEIMDKKL